MKAVWLTLLRDNDIRKTDEKRTVLVGDNDERNLTSSIESTEAPAMRLSRTSDTLSARIDSIKFTACIY